MQKALLHFVVLAVVFFGVWRSLSQIDFRARLNIVQLSKDNEQKIGDFMLKLMRGADEELHADAVSAFVERVKDRICKANSIAGDTIMLHILKKNEVNAFVLPGRHLVVNSGLIGHCRNPEELSGVIAHEIAHMERGHVMKKLTKEVGLSMLTLMAGGDSSGEIGRQTLTLLSSTAFDREQENEADIDAVHMMAKADIDPEHLANLFFRFSQDHKSVANGFKWINTHPDSQDRSSMILELRKKEKYTVRPIAGVKEWEALLKSFDDEDEKTSR
jgi:predicted Zn-dependent protease